MAVETLEVALGERSYPVHVGSGLLPRAGELLAAVIDTRRTAVVSDETVAELHLSTLLSSLDEAGFDATPFLVPAGEPAKSFETYVDLSIRLLDLKLGRDGSVIALGGGCIGDLAGFAAATLYRGVRCAQIPTTLLAQVDSSVGGKTGINAPQGKNLVGAFHQPVAVIADTDALATLPAREMRAGYAEVAKMALLDDAALFEWLELEGGRVVARDEAPLVRAISAACAAKARIVGGDEQESGERALLNLGHTFAHALEAEEGHEGALSHGLAVSVGVVLAARTSEAMGCCPPGRAERIQRHLRSVGLPTEAGELPGAPFAPGRLLDRMAHDKKNRAGRPSLILLRDIGSAFRCEEPDMDLVRRELEASCARRR